MFFVLFPQKFLFRDTGQSGRSSLLVVETDCPLHIISELPTPSKKFTTEAVLQKFIQTVHVLVVETECLQFL